MNLAPRLAVLPTAGLVAKRVLKRGIYAFLERARADKILLRRIRRPDYVVVLNLHQVSPHQNPASPALHPRDFEDLVVYLKRHFVICRLRDCSEVTVQPKVVLSFDDGYYDFVEYASPVMARHNAVANQNVITGVVERGQAPWYVRLYAFVGAAPLPLVNELRVPGFSERLESREPAPIERFARSLNAALKNRPHAERMELFSSLESTLARADVPPVRMMGRADVVEAAKTHEIGAHGHEHDSLGLESSSYFQADFHECQRVFSNLRLPLEIFAFPNGSYRREQVSWLGGQGVRHVLLVGERLALSGAGAVPRISVHGESGAEMRLRSLGLRAHGAA